MQRFWLSIILFASLTNCTEKPPDVPVCENLPQRLSKDSKTDHLMLVPSPTCMKEIGEVECGHCTFIVSGKEIYVGEEKEHLFNDKPWSQLKLESIYVPAKESYAKIAAYMINSCKRANCSAEVTKFKVKIDGLKSAVRSSGLEEDSP